MRKVVQPGFRRKTDSVEDEVEQVLLEMNRQSMAERPKKTAPYVGEIKLLYLLHKFKKQACVLDGFHYDVPLDFFYVSSTNPVKGTPEKVADVILSMLPACMPVLVIPMGTSDPNHMMMLFVKKDEFELYDPEGGLLNPTLHMFLEEVGERIGIPFRYQPPTCGIQRYEQRYFSQQLFKEDPGGFCIDWSFFMVEMRLRFPQLTVQKLEALFFDFVDVYRIDVLAFIRGQSAFVHRLKVDIGQNTFEIDSFEMGPQFMEFYRHLAETMFKGDKPIRFY